MLSTLLAVAIAMPTPSPSPLPPTIIYTVSSATCATLQNVTRPVGYVTRVNDKAFKAMALTTQKFLSGIMPGDVPTAAQVRQAFGDGPDVPASNGTGSAASTEMSSSSGDDPVIYSPQHTIEASDIDQLAQAIIGNITLERSYIDQSLKKYPPGTDPRVDALRAQAQNLIALQSAAVSRYETFAGMYIDNMGVADMTRGRSLAMGGNGPDGQVDIKTALRELLLGDASGLGASPRYRSDKPYYGYGSIQDLAKDGSTGEVISAMRDQEVEFTKGLFSAYNECHGTHIVLKTPPTPKP